MSSGKHNTQAITDSSHSQPNAVERLFAVLNRGDRFNLADDPTVKAGNLENDIHPVFHHSHFLGRSKHLKQALQLASLYLTTPSLLDFYLPLTFGSFHQVDKRMYRTYVRVEEISRELELQCMQGLMRCLSHSLTWEWKDFKAGKKWGSTRYYEDHVTDHTDECPVYADDKTKHFFKTNTGCKITLNQSLLDYYLDEDTGYVTRSRCEQFRHDFQLALTLGHEIAHAYGAMSQENLREPWLAQDHPKNEQGYAWENFVFGSLIDPVDQNPSGNYIHAHKTWQSRDTRNKYRGCEWTAVPVAWTAQWFRTETWEEIEVYGHRAVALPDPTLKIYFSLLNLYVVFTDDDGARKDLEWARYSASLGYLFAKGGVDAASMKAVSLAAWMPMSELAEESLMPTPQRHFDEALVSDRQFLRNAKDREWAVYTTLEVAEKKLSRTKMISVAAGLIASYKHTGVPRPVRVSEKLSVAAGSMTSRNSDSSPKTPKFPKVFSRNPQEQFFSGYIGTRPEFHEPRPVSSRAKRSRDADHLDAILPGKKARRGY
ncbi:hypothetical protein P171DRAFT_444798 [Karstenula rhodostoma CBS 690.94]|uniref:Uncharacterized protein n=1 Tax=Karstenula rhodostoma CBS 690.94 TaxID=1392251 RepID=A0A9P4PE41_9PLEO|nr:hypothetical protein P171DRAFT_444798 [Karstenula rhodostoma CBS 690.94]